MTTFSKDYRTIIYPKSKTTLVITLEKQHQFSKNNQIAVSKQILQVLVIASQILALRKFYVMPNQVQVQLMAKQRTVVTSIEARLQRRIKVAMKVAFSLSSTLQTAISKIALTYILTMQLNLQILQFLRRKSVLQISQSTRVHRLLSTPNHLKMAAPFSIKETSAHLSKHRFQILRGRGII